MAELPTVNLYYNSAPVDLGLPFVGQWDGSSFIDKSANMRADFGAYEQHDVIEFGGSTYAAMFGFDEISGDNPGHVLKYTGSSWISVLSFPAFSFLSPFRFLIMGGHLYVLAIGDPGPGYGWYIYRDDNWGDGYMAKGIVDNLTAASNAFLVSSISGDEKIYLGGRYTWSPSDGADVVDNGALPSPMVTITSMFEDGGQLWISNADSAFTNKIARSSNGVDWTIDYTISGHVSSFHKRGGTVYGVGPSGNEL